MNNDFDDYFKKIMDYFKVQKVNELAPIFGVSQPAISQLRSRNSISGLAKKCKELGIYEEIFGETNFNSITIKQGKKSKAAGHDLIENAEKNENVKINKFTFELIAQLIEKYGDEKKVQKKLMELMIDD